MTFIVGWIVDVFIEIGWWKTSLWQDFIEAIRIDLCNWCEWIEDIILSMIEYKLYVPLSRCAPNPWGTLETDSNTIIKLLEDEKRLRWKFNGLGLCCWARPSPSLPTRISSRSPRLAPIRVRHHGQHRTSHKNEIHHIRAETTRRVACRWLWRWVREIIMMMPCQEEEGGW